MKFPLWAKWVVGIIGLLIVLAIGTVTAIVNILKPERLTPMVEEYAPRFINGDLKANRIELTFWHTFPHFSVDIDSLTIISHSLNSLDSAQRARMPEWCDTLLTIDKFHGGLNLRKLLKGELEIFDVTMNHPSVNIVIADSTNTNYNIVEIDNDNEESAFKSFSIEHFALHDAGPIRYFSLPDTTMIELSVLQVEADGSESPHYQLTTSGEIQASLLDELSIEKLRFSFDGTIAYSFDKGLSHLTVNNIGVFFSDISSTWSTDVDFGDSIKINTLTAEINGITYESVKGFLDDEQRKNLQSLDTNMEMAIRFALTSPYVYDTAKISIPSCVVDVEIPKCRVIMPLRRLNINTMELKAKATIDGNKLDNSKLELYRLFIDGYAIDLDLKGIVTQPLSNPRIAGEIKGRLIIENLPPILLAQFPGHISGTVGINTAFRFKQSQLNSNDFHKIYARGTVSLRDFDVFTVHIHSDEEQPDTLKLYTPLTMLQFDSDKKYETNGVTIDSLLSLTVTTDSLHYYGEGMTLGLKNMEAAFGTKNIAQSSDTTVINPFGGHLSIDRLRLRSDIDSTRISLSGIKADASLTRYNGREKVPLLKLNTNARRLSLTTPDARISISRPAFTFSANLNPRRHETNRHRLRRNDSISTSTDTLRHNRRPHVKEESQSEENLNKGRTRHLARHNNSEEQTDSVTTGLRNLIRRWNASGELTASRARLFTHAFPINNTISDIDLLFTTDSIRLRSLRLKAGDSDFAIKGTVSGIKNYMNRRNKQPLKIEFAMQSDTIDIDRLSRVVFAGTTTKKDTTIWNSSADETADVSDVIEIDTTTTSPLIISPDLDASLRFRAKNVVYMGMLLHDFRGELAVWDAAIHLHDLQAQSPMGGISVSALYNAPSMDNLEFGMGMELKDFHIEKFLKLTPAINELLPAIKDFSGIINADIAMTTRLDSVMDFIIPSVQADVKIDGDSLVLLDADTFKSLSKWLMFKDKKRNLIDRMSVELQVDSSQIILYPFIFNIDRYKLGVMGSNDLDMNLNYHVSVLKSPIPFKFGINITGNIDKMKIKLGGAKIKENTVVERMAINSDARINLVDQLEGVFRRGANSANENRIHIHRDEKHARELRKSLAAEADTLTSEQESQL